VGSRLSELSWMDGDRERSVWLDRGVIVEFRPTEAGRRTLEGRALRELRSTPSGARLWSVPDGFDAHTVCSEVLSGSQVRVSPAFRPAAGAGGAVFGLPGGVVVYLDPDWSESQVEQWLADRQLTASGTLDMLPNAYLIDSGPGLPSLELANELYEADETRLACPNWWREVSR